MLAVALQIAVKAYHKIMYAYVSKIRSNVSHCKRRGRVKLVLERHQVWVAKLMGAAVGYPAVRLAVIWNAETFYLRQGYQSVGVRSVEEGKAAGQWRDLSLGCLYSCPSGLAWG